MSVTLAPDSPRRAVARTFGRELRRAMNRRAATVRGLAKEAEVSRTGLVFYLDGVNLPRIETAQRLAEALDCPRLIEIAVGARAGTCERCGRSFEAQGSGNKRYCSEDCRRLTAGDRVRSGPVRERAIVAERTAARYVVAVESYCRGCEPEGTCRTPACELRPVSPLPMHRRGAA